MAMSRAEIAETIEKMIRDAIKKTPDEEAITDETSFSKLGIDSLDQAELIMDIEEAFKIDMEQDKVATLKTFGELVTMIESKKNPPDAGPVAAA